jgi:hypothetical protein
MEDNTDSTAATTFSTAVSTAVGSGAELLTCSHRSGAAQKIWVHRRLAEMWVACNWNVDSFLSVFLTNRFGIGLTTS